MWIALRLVNILSTISDSRLTNERVSQARRHRLSSARRPRAHSGASPWVENACTVHPWCHHSNYVNLLVFFRCSSKIKYLFDAHARAVAALIDKRLL
ncbi:hypothetical protein EVAR_11860_1 [Eumeta japonica]|uniref:Uncharacterized protein n=1 Tax=Eumeta variegata TaxID=151549 RepID=A0A4C1U7J5_EUMVA|nr:hypothetical protein EVAR_11860_1 [Eumeta japonica]